MYCISLPIQRIVVQSLSCVQLYNSMDRSTRLPCPSPSPRACSNYVHWVSDGIQPSRPLSSSSPPAQSFPASGSFLMSQVFASVCQSIGVSASVSVLPMNIQGWFPLELTVLITLQSKGLWGVFSNTIVQKHEFLGTQLSLWSNSNIQKWLLEKLWLWLDGPLSAKWCLCFLYAV